MAFTQQRAFELLQHAVAQKRLPHALLITGTESAGTHQLVLRMAELLNHATAPSLKELTHPMFRLMRPGSKSRAILVDDIRANESFLSLRAAEGEYKIIAILDADRMKEEASNAFLKTLEEPPPQTLIMLITEHPSRLLPTILSRCIRIDLQSTDKRVQLTEVQELFLPHLLTALEQLGDPCAAIILSAEIQSLLLSRKDVISTRLTKQLKEQSKVIADGTGIRDWEAQNKDATIALIEAHYLREREEVFELFSLAFGQAVLHASHAPNLELISPVLEQLAQKESLATLIRRMEALDKLRRDLVFNIKDTLAFDIHLSDVIGDGLNI